MWSSLESYRQLEREYEQAREEYARRESEYRDLLANDRGNPELRTRYSQLADLKRKVDDLYSQLTALRNELASSA
jgi:CHASE3 domain sensor protein